MGGPGWRRLATMASGGRNGRKSLVVVVVVVKFCANMHAPSIKVAAVSLREGAGSTVRPSRAQVGGVQ